MPKLALDRPPRLTVPQSEVFLPPLPEHRPHRLYRDDLELVLGVLDSLAVVHWHEPCPHCLRLRQELVSWVQGHVVN